MATTQELQALANKLQTGFQFRMPSGDIIQAGINPNQAATVSVEDWLTGAMAVGVPEEFSKAIRAEATAQLAGRIPVYDPNRATQDRPGTPDLTPGDPSTQIAPQSRVGEQPYMQITPQTIEQGLTQVAQGTPGYGQTSYKGVSIVDYLSSLGKPTDFTSRTALANQMGIQNYTGTAEQNTQLLNKLRGQGEISQLAPSGVTATGMTGGTTAPINLPTGGTTGATTASSIVAGADSTMKSIEDYIKMLTPEISDNQTKYDDILSQLEGLIPQAGGRGAAQSEAEAKQGVDALRTSLANVNAEIYRKTAEYKALSTDVEGKPITMASIIGSQAQIQKAMASDIGLLQAQALGLTGQLDVAQGIADRSVDLKYQDTIDAVDIRLKQLELLQGELTKSEKIRSDAITLYLNDQKTAIATEVANEKDKNATLLNLMQKYVDAGITLNDTIESANKKIRNNSAIYKKEITISNEGKTRQEERDTEFEKYVKDLALRVVSDDMTREDAKALIKTIYPDYDENVIYSLIPD